MEAITAWLLHLNEEHHWGFAIATVVTMTGLGALIGSAIEVVLKALGVSSGHPSIKR